MAVVDKCSIIGPWRVPTSWRLCNYTCRWSAVKVVLKSSRFSQRVTEYPSKRASMFTGESVLGVFISLPTFILANADFTSASFTLLPSLNLQHLKRPAVKLPDMWFWLFPSSLYVVLKQTECDWNIQVGRTKKQMEICFVFSFQTVLSLCSRWNPVGPALLRKEVSRLVAAQF